MQQIELTGRQRSADCGQQREPSDRELPRAGRNDQADDDQQRRQVIAERHLREQPERNQPDSRDRFELAARSTHDECRDTGGDDRGHAQHPCCQVRNGGSRPRPAWRRLITAQIPRLRIFAVDPVIDGKEARDDRHERHRAEQHLVQARRAPAPDRTP